MLLGALPTWLHHIIRKYIDSSDAVLSLPMVLLHQHLSSICYIYYRVYILVQEAHHMASPNASRMNQSPDPSDDQYGRPIRTLQYVTNWIDMISAKPCNKV